MAYYFNFPKNLIGCLSLHHVITLHLYFNYAILNIFPLFLLLMLNTLPSFVSKVNSNFTSYVTMQGTATSSTLHF